MDVRIGLCGFSMAFDEYVREFPMVEVQQTFYEPPRDATMRRWRSEAPAGFEFTIKAWQLVTHEATSPTYRRLRRPLTDDERHDAGSFRLTPIVLDAWRRTLGRVAADARVRAAAPRDGGAAPVPGELPADRRARLAAARVRYVGGAAGWRPTAL